MSQETPVKKVKVKAVPANASPEQAPKKKPKKSLAEDILSLFLKICFILLAFVLMFTFLFGITRNSSLAMMPNMKVGDVIVYYRLDKMYVQNTVVAVEYNDEVQILRVVAVAGDTVDMTEEGFVVNGSLQEEPAEGQLTQPFTEGVDFPITLEEGEVFLLGDNRNNSTADSRLYGPVKAEETLGEVMTVIRRRNL